MVEQLSAIFDRLGRTEEHLKTVKCELLRYYDADPAEITGEYKPDPNGHVGEGEWTSMTIAAIGDRLNTIVGEMLHDLRSSLDHLAWQLVLENKGRPSDATSFPIWKVGPTPNAQGKQRPPNVAGGVSPEALALIESVQPYKWGEAYAQRPLWALNQLWNIDKHRHVVVAGVRTRAVFMGPSVPAFRFAARLHSTTVNGAKYLLAPDDSTVDVDAHATVEVAIREPDSGIEAPLLGTLEHLLETVVRVVTTAEDCCF